MCVLLQVVLEVVEDAQLVERLGAVGRVLAQGQLLQLQSSAPQQSEAVLMKEETDAQLSTSEM